MPGPLILSSFLSPTFSLRSLPGLVALGLLCYTFRRKCDSYVSVWCISLNVVSFGSISASKDTILLTVYLYLFFPHPCVGGA